MSMDVIAKMNFFNRIKGVGLNFNGVLAEIISASLFFRDEQSWL